MADPRDGTSAWHGHTLRPLPAGESWFCGGERRAAITPQPVYRHDTYGDPLVSSWLLDDVERATSGTVAIRAPGHPRSVPRTGAFLLAVILTAIMTIVFARRTGAPAEPAPLPAPPSHEITSVTRAQATTTSIRVGDYLDFRLASGRTYSTVLEQPSGQIPVVEALTLPGQQPQLRGDSAGHAVIEVMAAPECANAGGCPEQRTLVGTVELTVTP